MMGASDDHTTFVCDEAPLPVGDDPYGRRVRPPRPEADDQVDAYPARG